MPLIDSVATWVLDNLPYDRADRKVDAALKAKSGPELLVIYMNWRNRLVTPAPRIVLRSSAFDTNPVVKQRQGEIAEIIDDIEQGRELTKHLSRSVRVGFALPENPKRKQLGRRKDLDLLLNDWGIHHLHLSRLVEPDGFVKRAGPIIFAIFKPGRAYLIDVMGHGDWAREQVIRLIIETWPNQGLISELKGVIGTSRPYTDEERAQLRGAGIATGVQIGDRVFVSGTGFTTAGTSGVLTIAASRILRMLKHFEEQANANPDKIINLIRQHGGQLDGKPEFVFSVFDNGWGVIESHSGASIVLGASA